MNYITHQEMPIAALRKVKVRFGTLEYFKIVQRKKIFSATDELIVFMVSEFVSKQVLKILKLPSSFITSRKLAACNRVIDQLSHSNKWTTLTLAKRLRELRVDLNECIAPNTKNLHLAVAFLSDLNDWTNQYQNQYYHGCSRRP
jgi:hypothetical protein